MNKYEVIFYYATHVFVEAESVDEALANARDCHLIIDAKSNDYPCHVEYYEGLDPMVYEV